MNHELPFTNDDESCFVRNLLFLKNPLTDFNTTV